MAISRIGASNLIATTGVAPGAITPNAGTAVGDWLVFFHYSRIGTLGTQTVTVPTGFTQIVNHRDGNGLIAVAWRFRQAGDTTYTATITGHATGTSGDSVLEWIETFRGVHSTPIGQVLTTPSTWASSLNIGPIAVPTSPSVPVGGALIVFGGREENITAQTTLTGNSLTWAQGVRNDTTSGLDAGAVTQWGLNETAGAIVPTAKTITTTGTAQVGKGTMFTVAPVVDVTNTSTPALATGSAVAPGAGVTSPRATADAAGTDTGLVLDPPPFITDTFTGTPGALLEARSGELNAAWTRHPSYSTVSLQLSAGGDRLRASSSFTGCYYASGVPQTSEYDVVADLFVASVSATIGSGVAGRIDTATNTMYVGRWNQATLCWHLLKIVAGTATILASSDATTLTVSQTYNVRLVIRDTEKSLYVDDVQVATSTDNQITGAGRAGVRLFDSGGVDGVHFDNFNAYDLSAFQGPGAAASVPRAGASASSGPPGVQAAPFNLGARAGGGIVTGQLYPTDILLPADSLFPTDGVSTNPPDVAAGLSVSSATASAVAPAPTAVIPGVTVEVPPAIATATKFTGVPNFLLPAAGVLPGTGTLLGGVPLPTGPTIAVSGEPSPADSESDAPEVVVTVPAASASATMAVPGGAPPVTTPIDQLTDAFDDGTIDPAKWPTIYGSANVSETGGQLRVVQTEEYAGIVSTYTFSLQNSSVYVEVPGVPVDPSAFAENAYLAVQGEGALWRAIIDQVGPELRFYQTVNGARDFTAVTYNPVTHRWWRIREASGTVFWETSPDTSIWTIRRSSAALGSNVYSGMAVELGSGGATAGEALFDNLNVVVPVTVAVPAGTASAVMPAPSPFIQGEGPAIDLPTPLLLKPRTTTLTLASRNTTMTIDPHDTSISFDPAVTEVALDG